MKRKLTQMEKEMTTKGLDRNKKELSILKNQLKYNEELLAQQKAKADLDDKWRPFLRETTAHENEQALKSIRDSIKQKEESVQIAESHLREGVTIKEHQAG